jgi:uncharacterized protein YjiS (DUF1127 family)
MRHSIMAFYSHTGVHRPTLAERVQTMIAQVGRFRARRAIYLKTLRELSALSDRELNDIGISRYDIEDVARAHVR